MILIKWPAGSKLNCCRQLSHTPVIIPAQRAALIGVKALGNALNMEAMPTPFRHPPAATILLQANRAGSGALFSTDASLLHAEDFFHETD